MFSSIDVRLKFYKHILMVINFVIFITTIFTVYLLFNLYFIQNVNNSYNKDISLISNIVEKPKLQTYDNNGKIIIAIADKASITEDIITAFSVKINSKNLKLDSKIVDLNNKNDEIILKNRPVILFYEEK